MLLPIIMEKSHNLNIKVYMSSPAVKPVLERDIYLHQDIAVPYNSIVSVMRFLYGKKSVVVFKSEYLDDISGL